LLEGLNLSTSHNVLSVMLNKVAVAGFELRLEHRATSAWQGRLGCLAAHDFFYARCGAGLEASRRGDLLNRVWVGRGESE